MSRGAIKFGISCVLVGLIAVVSHPFLETAMLTNSIQTGLWIMASGAMLFVIGGIVVWAERNGKTQLETKVVKCYRKRASHE